MDLSSSFYITVYWNAFVSEKDMLEFKKKSLLFLRIEPIIYVSSGVLEW